MRPSRNVEVTGCRGSGKAQVGATGQPDSGQVNNASRELAAQHGSPGDCRDQRSVGAEDFHGIGWAIQCQTGATEQRAGLGAGVTQRDHLIGRISILDQYRLLAADNDEGAPPRNRFLPTTALFQRAAIGDVTFARPGGDSLGAELQARPAELAAPTLWSVCDLCALAVIPWGRYCRRAMPSWPSALHPGKVSRGRDPSLPLSPSSLSGSRPG